MKPSWNDIKVLGNSTIVKSSYYWVVIVPIFAKLYPHVESLLRSKGYDLDLTLPFSWHMFYFGSVCFAIASLIFALMCPFLIRQYNDPNEYRARGKGLTELRRYFNTTTKDLNEEEKKVMEAAFKSIESKIIAKISDNSEQDFNSLFWIINKGIKSKRTIARMSCVIFYFAGLILFFIVLVENFLYVWNDFLVN